MEEIFRTKIKPANDKLGALLTEKKIYIFDRSSFGQVIEIHDRKGGWYETTCRHRQITKEVTIDYNPSQEQIDLGTDRDETREYYLCRNCGDDVTNDVLEGKIRGFYE